MNRLERIATLVSARVHTDMTDPIKVHITEAPNTIQVEFNGETHSATWPDIDLGDLEDVVGDATLLSAALCAWDGESDFEITPEELAERGGGYWAPSSK